MTVEATIQASRAPMPAGLPVRLNDVRVEFPSAAGPLEALRGLTLDIPAGSLTVIIGPNGCGKSTLLRVIAGLLQPTEGSVRIGDGVDAGPRAGDGLVGLAFQQPRLVPWLTILDNVALPLTFKLVSRLPLVAARQGSTPANVGRTLPRSRPANVARILAQEALDRVGLTDAAQLRPSQLSGGMAQRAGLARALITDPPILLLDEPFSALDALTREGFDGELQRLWMDRPRTVMLVTHSVTEAVRMADRIVVMTARPGAVARVIPVDLPRPRPATLAGEPAAAGIDAAVRAALAEVHPAELTPWLDR
ncbi:MAG TPA: ABC transporter ATP-binding protein [Candidatus Saccharimonadales bacterium]|nr:ABC transporter ATP-binding protein [Candidatus Saccharimonadales bacterium]